MTDPSIADPASPYSPALVAKPAPAPTKPGGAARTKLMLEGPILPTLLRLSTPNVLNFLAFVGMITFDGFFLGRLGTDVLAGASLAFPFVMLVLQATNSGMGHGVSSAIARAPGSGQRDRAERLVVHAVLPALWLAPSSLARSCSADHCCFAGWAARTTCCGRARLCERGARRRRRICVLNFLGNAVRGTGNMTLPASVLVGCVVAHIALAPLLIFGAGPVPALGPAGAAWGLVLPFAVGSIGLIWYLRSGRSSIQLNFRGVTPRWELFADILKVGVPGLVNIAVTNLSVMALTAVAARLGRDVALGYAMGARLEYVLQPIAFGVGTTIVAMVGTNWGARQYRRARAIAWTGATLVAAVCGTIRLIVSVDQVSGRRSDDADVFWVGGLYLRIVGQPTCAGLGLGLFYVAQGFGRGTSARSPIRHLVVSASVGSSQSTTQSGPRRFFAAVQSALVSTPPCSSSPSCA